MKYFRILFWLLVCTTTTVFSQEKFIKHKISQGETISSIAEKYNVSQKAIFNLNPKASGILKLNAVLKIPNKNYEKEVAQKELAAKKKTTKEINYVVLPKETLFGIAQKFNLKVEEIKKSNPSIAKSGLKIGEKIKLIVPENFELKPEVVVAAADVSEQSKSDASNSNSMSEFVGSTTSNEAQQIHEVAASETKYGISKRYGISVDVLEKLNPSIASKSLVIGQKLNVPLQNKATTEVVQTVEVAKSSEVQVANPTAATNEQVVTQTSVTNTSASPETAAIVHEVLPKETKYGIAKKYGITVAELDRLNPSNNEKLRVGSVLKIKEGTATVAVTEEIEKKEETVVAEPSSEIYFGDYSVADDLIAKASDNLGIRYRSGGTSKAGFDCSGLVCSTFGALDIKLPRSSSEMSTIGTRVTSEEAQKGDLIFFKTRGSRRINHVGMVVEVVGDEIKFIHSSTSKGVIISSTKEGYYQRNFAQVNRVLK